MGAQIERSGRRVGRVQGVGVGGLLQPLPALDMGNSGTAARLLMGVSRATTSPPASPATPACRRRPHEPGDRSLARMGASFTPSPGGTLPLMLTASSPAVPIEYRLRSPPPSEERDTSRRAQHLGSLPWSSQCPPAIIANGCCGRSALTSKWSSRRRTDHPPARRSGPVPAEHRRTGDPFVSGFPYRCALLVEGSDLCRKCRPQPHSRRSHRGAASNGRQHRTLWAAASGGEPVADLRVRHSRLQGFEVAPSLPHP
jgi:3-phosphoshikimate 1-carboxyvinyltransferase